MSDPIAPPEAPEIRLRPAVYWCTLVAVASTAFSIALSSLALGAAGVLWLFGLVRSRGKSFMATPLDILLLAYCCIELVVSAFSPEPGHSFVNARRLLLILLIQAIGFGAPSAKSLGRFLAVVIGAAAVVSLLELFALSTDRGHFLRLSVFQYFLTEGGIKMIALLLLIPFLSGRGVEKRVRLAALAASLPLFIGLVLTQTRSSWLGFIGGVAVIGILRDRRLLLVLVLLVVLFLLFAPHDFRTRAASIFDPTMTSNLTRIHMVETGWRMFLDRPLTGFGDIDLRRYYVTYTTPLDDAEGGHLHNNVMMLLVTLGAVGFAVIMAIFARIAMAGFRAYRSSRGSWREENLALGCLAAYTGFHINGLFEWNFGDQEIAILFWTMVAVMLALQRLADAGVQGKEAA